MTTPTISNGDLNSVSLHDGDVMTVQGVCGDGGGKGEPCPMPPQRCDAKQVHNSSFNLTPLLITKGGAGCLRDLRNTYPANKGANTYKRTHKISFSLSTLTLVTIDPCRYMNT